MTEPPASDKYVQPATLPAAGSRAGRVAPWWQRYLLIAAGTAALVLGAIGIVMPVLPTTPFILLAAACYARSSQRFYSWLMRHRIFGGIVRQWRESRTIPRRAKWVALVLVVVAFAVTLIWVPNCVYGYITLVVIAVALLVFLGRLPTVGAVRS